MLSTFGVNILLQECNSCNDKKIQFTYSETNSTLSEKHCYSLESIKNQCGIINNDLFSCCQLQNIYLKNNIELTSRLDFQKTVTCKLLLINTIQAQFRSYKLWLEQIKFIHLKVLKKINVQALFGVFLC